MQHSSSHLFNPPLPTSLWQPTSRTQREAAAAACSHLQSAGRQADRQAGARFLRTLVTIQPFHCKPASPVSDSSSPSSFLPSLSTPEKLARQNPGASWCGSPSRDPLESQRLVLSSGQQPRKKWGRGRCGAACSPLPPRSQASKPASQPGRRKGKGRSRPESPKRPPPALATALPKKKPDAATLTRLP